MKLILSEDTRYKPSDRARRVLWGSFDYLTKTMGISWAKAVVELSFAKDLEIKDSAGCVATVDWAKENIPMVLSVREKLWRQLHVFCHEMVHVDQIVRGDLQVSSKGALWQGRLFSREYMRAARGDPKFLPQEREAYARMDDLLKGAIGALPMDDAIHLLSQMYEDSK